MNQPMMHAIEPRRASVQALSESLDSLTDSACLIPSSMALHHTPPRNPSDGRFFDCNRVKGGHLFRDHADNDYANDSDSSSCSSTTRGRRRFRKQRPRLRPEQRRLRTEVVVTYPMNLLSGQVNRSTRWTIMNGIRNSTTDSSFPSDSRFYRQRHEDEASISSLSSFETTMDDSSSDEDS